MGILCTPLHARSARLRQSPWRPRCDAPLMVKQSRVMMIWVVGSLPYLLVMSSSFTLMFMTNRSPSAHLKRDAHKRACS